MLHPPRVPFWNKEPVSLAAGYVSGIQISAVSPLGVASDKESDFALGHIFPQEASDPVAQPSCPNSGSSEGSFHFQNSPHFHWYCIPAPSLPVPTRPPSLHPMGDDLKSTRINLLHDNFMSESASWGFWPRTKNLLEITISIGGKLMFSYRNALVCPGLRQMSCVRTNTGNQKAEETTAS